MAKQKNKLGKRIVVTGGGSGGHVSVALAFIQELNEKYEDVQENLLYIGGDLAMEGEKDQKSHEEKRVEGKNIKFEKIRAGKLQRSFSLNSIKLLFRTFLGIFDAYKLLKKFKPDIIFSAGGFVTVPVNMVGGLMKIPIYLHEQTAAVGLTNKVASKFAKRIYITFPQSERYFPPGKTLHTGNIVRKTVFDDKPSEEWGTVLKRMKSRKDQFPIVLIMGGGQGSHVINATIREMLNYITLNYQIILQTGDNQNLKDYDVIYKEWKKLPKDLQERVYITKFISDDDIGAVFKAADLFMGRAGANTVYELGVLEIPSILIPIPWVTHNEQEKNARILKDLGLARILPEGQLSANKVKQELDNFFQYHKRDKYNSQEIEKTFKRNALETIFKDMF